jgi:hypothetical protein
MLEPIKLDFKCLPIRIQNVFDDNDIEYPVALAEHDLTGCWIYDREYGVFEVPIGYHECVMAYMYAWKKGYQDPFDIPDLKSVTINYLAAAAEEFLSLPGTAYMSGAWYKSEIRAGKRGNLNRNELNYFGEVDYILED